MDQFVARYVVVVLTINLNLMSKKVKRFVNLDCYLETMEQMLQDCYLMVM